MLKLIESIQVNSNLITPNTKPSSNFTCNDTMDVSDHNDLKIKSEQTSFEKKLMKKKFVEIKDDESSEENNKNEEIDDDRVTNESISEKFYESKITKTESVYKFKRKTRTDWDSKETEYLVSCAEKYGRNWNYIFKTFQNNFRQGRRISDLRKKYYQLKHKRLEKAK